MQRGKDAPGTKAPFPKSFPPDFSACPRKTKRSTSKCLQFSDTRHNAMCTPCAQGPGDSMPSSSVFFRSISLAFLLEPLLAPNLGAGTVAPPLVATIPRGSYRCCIRQWKGRSGRPCHRETEGQQRDRPLKNRRRGAEYPHCP